MPIVNNDAEGSKSILRAVDLLYRNCVRPIGLLHAVSCPPVRAVDGHLAQALRYLSGRLDEPTAESAYRQLRSFRWDLLTDCRAPAALLQARGDLFARVVESWNDLGLSVLQLQPLRKAIDGIRLLGESPLLSAILEIFDDEDGRDEMENSVLIPYGRFERVSRRRCDEAASALSRAGLTGVAAVTLSEARSRAVVCDQVLFVGSPKAFGQSVVTCPIARVSHFVYYDFIRAEYENAGWPHSFSPLSADLPEPHWMSFERVLHDSFASAVGDPTAQIAASEHEALEDKIYSPLRFRQLVQYARSELGDQDDVESCTCVLLEDDFWAALPGQARIMVRERKEWTSRSVEPNELEPGDLLLLHLEESQDLAQETISAVELTNSAGIESWKAVQEFARSEIGARGWEVFSEELIKAGVCAPHRYWFEDGRLGPKDDQVFLQLCAAVGLGEEEAARALTAVRAWHRYRISAGHQISDRFAAEAARTLNRLELNRDAKDHEPPSMIPISLPEEHLGSQCICRVVGILGEDFLPASRSRRVLTPRGAPWRG